MRYYNGEFLVTAIYLINYSLKLNMNLEFSVDRTVKSIKCTYI